MKFPYKKLSSTFSRPIIPVGISYDGGTEITFEALIDSGADMCLIGKQMGKLLGVPIRRGRYGSVKGISGKTQSHYEHSITISVGGWKFNTKASFLVDDELPYPLLGQRGFFDLFKITFNHAKQEIEIKPRT